MKKIILYSVLVFLVTLLILNPEKSILYTKNGITLCQEIIIPSLFPFFVCSGLLVYSGFCEMLAKLTKPIMKPLFNINPTGSAAFILGLISGYPLGAVTACQLYESMYVSKSEAERLLAFCNNSGPLFILGAVGISMFHSPQAGIILYVSHILGAMTVGVLFRFYKSNTFNAPISSITSEKKSIPELFSIVLTNSIQSILTVCGCVVFSSVMANLIMDMLYLSPTFKAIINSSLEFVSGLSRISYLDTSLFSKLIMSAGVCAFAGLSVHMQVMGVASKSGLSLKPYILGKAFHAFFAIIYTFILLKLFPFTSTVFEQDLAPCSISAGFFICSVYSIISVLFVVSMIILYFTGKLSKKSYKRIISGNS